MNTTIMICTGAGILMRMGGLPYPNTGQHPVHPGATPTSD